MKVRILIDLGEKIKETFYEVGYGSDEEDSCCFVIYTNGKERFNDLISNKEAFIKALDDYKNERIMVGGAAAEYIEDYDFVDNLKEHINHVAFDASKNDFNYVTKMYDYLGEDLDDEEKQVIIDEYMNNNPELKDYPIVINEKIDINTDMNKIEEKYKDYKVLIQSPDSYGFMSIEEAKNGNYISNFIKKVKELQLTPLETVLFVYDVVREKPYLLEDDGEDLKDSRSIYTVVNNDKVVCAGYANLLNEILNQLGIRNEYITLYKEDDYAGHARNIIRINDPKYNVNGIFFLDATMDNSRNSKADKWLYSYDGFLKKKKTMDKSDRKYKLHNDELAFLDDYDISDMDVVEHYMGLDFEEILKKYSKSLVIGNKDAPEMGESLSEYNEKMREVRNYIKVMLKLYGANIDGIESNKEILGLYKSLYTAINDDYNTELPLSTFLKALIRVRYNENKIDPERYPFDIDTIWSYIPTYRFTEPDEQEIINQSSAEQLLLMSIFGQKADIKPTSDEERVDLLKKGYRRLCETEKNIVKNDDEKGYIKVVDSIKLYNYDKKEI